MSAHSQSRPKLAPSVELPGAGMERFVSGATSAGGLLAFLVAWELVVAIFGIRETLLPAPSSILRHLADNVPLFWSASMYSLSTAVKGFLLATLVGVTIALIFVRSEY